MCVLDFDGFFDDEEARRDIANLSHQIRFENVDKDVALNLL